VKKLYTAKRITIVYFSLIAIALASLHFSVYQLTTSDLEQLYATNRLANIKHYTSDLLVDKSVKDQTKLDIKTQEHAAIDKGFTLYFDFSQLPAGLPKANSLAYDEAIEVKPSSNNVDTKGKAYFIQKSQIRTLDGIIDVYFIVDNNLYEFSEGQLLSLHSKQLVISLLLLAISLFSVIKIADKLTRPTSELAATLSNRAPYDLTPLPMSDNVRTIEHAKLIDTFNHYQIRIGESIERERSFNRFASHELRSPLMVMTGSLNILEESIAPNVVITQRKRLQKATREMTEFVDTLLSLTKSIAHQALTLRLVTRPEIDQIIETHHHLIANKPIELYIDIQQEPEIKIPSAAFHILLGNIIKNAYSYTIQGEVHIVVDQDKIIVRDSGKGINTDKPAYDGYGLGLLIVKELCNRYHFTFDLCENEHSGCTATITFNENNIS